MFEVDPYDEDANRDPKPIKALGRYAHEALVADPDRRHDLSHRGCLEPERAALSLDVARRPRHGRSARAYSERCPTTPAPLGPEGVDAQTARTCPISRLPRCRGRRIAWQWVTVPDRDAFVRSRNAPAVRERADHAQPQARGHVVGRRRRLLRLLGRPLTDGSAAQHDGQIWFLDPRADTIELKLHFAYTPMDRTAIKTADNIRSRPTAEDHRQGRNGKNHLVGATESGEAFFFARNEDPGDSEFTGRVLPGQEDPVRQRPIARVRLRDPGTVPQAALRPKPGVGPSQAVAVGPLQAVAPAAPVHDRRGLRRGRRLYRQTGSTACSTRRRHSAWLMDLQLGGRSPSSPGRAGASASDGRSRASRCRAHPNGGFRWVT